MKEYDLFSGYGRNCCIARLAINGSMSNKAINKVNHSFVVLAHPAFVCNLRAVPAYISALVSYEKKRNVIHTK